MFKYILEYVFKYLFLDTDIKLLGSYVLKIEKFKHILLDF